MKRQNFRFLIIFISFLLFPITLNYFSPYVIIYGASIGIVSASFIVFVSMFVFSLFFGRIFCGWLCPVGGMQEACFSIKNKAVKGGKLNWVKYFVWIIWLGIIIAMFIATGGILGVQVTLLTDNGISVNRPEAFIIYYSVVFLIFLMSVLIGKRAFCHYLCWMAPFMVLGRKLRNLVGWRAFAIKGDSSTCIDCKACSKNCPMSLSVNEMVKKENMENSECIHCLKCVDICPKNSIKSGFFKKTV